MGCSGMAGSPTTKTRSTHIAFVDYTGAHSPSHSTQQRNRGGPACPENKPRNSRYGGVVPRHGEAVPANCRSLSCVIGIIGPVVETSVFAKPRKKSRGKPRIGCAKRAAPNVKSGAIPDRLRFHNHRDLCIGRSYSRGILQYPEPAHARSSCGHVVCARRAHCPGEIQSETIPEPRVAFDQGRAPNRSRLYSSKTEYFRDVPR